MYGKYNVKMKVIMKTKRSCTEMDMKIGKLLEEVRISKNLSRNQMAGILDISVPQLDKYEKGINRIPLSRFLYISKILNTPEFLGFCNSLIIWDSGEKIIGIEGDKDAWLSTFLPLEERRFYLKVLSNIIKIQNPKLRDILITFIKNISNIV